MRFVTVTLAATFAALMAVCGANMYGSGYGGGGGGYGAYGAYGGYGGGRQNALYIPYYYPVKVPVSSGGGGGLDGLGFNPGLGALALGDDDGLGGGGGGGYFGGNNQGIGVLLALGLLLYVLFSNNSTTTG